MKTESCEPALDLRMQLGECPIWHYEEAALYWIDIEACMLHRLKPATGVHRQWPLPSQPGCIAFHIDGGLVVAMRSGIALLDTNDGTLMPLVDAPYNPSTTRFNDGRCDAAGRLWVGTIYEPRDQPNAALYCFERGELRDSGKRSTVSNGVAFSADNDTMYHSDTTSHRIRRYAFDLSIGTLGEDQVLKQFSTDKNADYGGRPDGGAVDSEGAYWCAMYEGSRLLRLSPKGEILREIALPVRCPTMMAFGDDDLRTLYITSVSKGRAEQELADHPLSGQLLRIRVDVAGIRENFYRPS
jgi:sugar lactone lactonase YvrE